MATRKIVPRATGEGSIGKSSKHWGAGHFDDLTVYDDMTVADDFAVSGKLTVTGTSDLNGVLEVAGTSTLSGAVVCNGVLSVAGTGTVTGILDVNSTASSDIAGDLTIQKNLRVTGTGSTIAEIIGPLTINEEIITEGTGSSTIAGDLSVAGNLYITGDGNFDEIVVAGTGSSTVAGDLSVAGNVFITGSATLDEEIIVDGTGSSTVAGDLTVTGELRVTATTTLADELIVSGAGSSSVAGDLTVTKNLRVTGTGSTIAEIIGPLTINEEIITEGTGSSTIAGDLSVSGNLWGADHDALHIKGGSDEIDADLLDIDYAESNYTPATAGVATDTDHLSAHLEGIDTALASRFSDNNLLTNSPFGVWSNSVKVDAATGVVPVTTNVCIGRGLAPNSCCTTPSADTEADATTGWTNVDFGTFASDTESTEPDGSHSLHCTANAGNQYCKIASAMTIVAGKLYQLDVVHKVVSGVTGQQAFLINVGSADTGNEYGTVVDIYNPAWDTTTVVFEATNTTCYVMFKETGAGNDVEFYVDQVALHEIEPGCIAADALGPDGWYKDTTLDLQRLHNDGGTKTHDGSFYALQCTPSAANDFAIWPLSAKRTLAEHYQRFAGRDVCFGAWVKTSTASHCFLQLIDSDTTDYDQTSDGSSLHTGGGAWEWLEVTMTVSASTTEFSVAIVFDQTSGVTYVSQPMLIFGDAIGEGNYTHPPSEIIPCEVLVPLNSWVGYTDLSATTVINLESQTNGMVPKGARAVNTALWGSCGTAEKFLYLVDSDSSPCYGTHIYSQVIDVITSNSSWTSCDANGDIKIMRNSTFNEINIYVTGVMI